jgi:KRAB domain-containing zinc finger protein
MTNYTIFILILSVTLAASAMEPISSAITDTSSKENEDYFLDCENLIDDDLHDFPTLSPVKIFASPRKIPAAQSEHLDGFDLNTLFASPKPSPSKPARLPLAPLAHAVLSKRVLFPEALLDADAGESQAAQVVTHTISPGPKRARTELPSLTQKKIYECPECGKHFNHNTELTNHILSHKGIKPFACPGCDKKFAQKNQRKAHMQRLHPAIEIPSESVAVVYDPTTYPKDKYPHHCNVCNKGFEDERGLSRHKIGMQYNESHQQLENEQKLNSSSLLPRPNTPAALQCEGVSQAPPIKPKSKTSSALPSTIAIALPTDRQLEKDEKIKKHLCTECGEKFARASTLEDHINLHKGIKPYECPYCDKKFVQRGNRNAHIKIMHKDLEIPHENSFVIHDAQTWPTDIYPHRCIACNKGFLRPIGLYLHQKHMSTNTAHLQLEEAQKQNSTMNPPQGPAALVSASQRMLESAQTETPESLCAPEDFVASFLANDTQAHLSAHEQPQGQDCTIPESVQADDKKTSQENLCTTCGKTFSARIFYLAHQLDSKCNPLAPAKAVDSHKQAAPVSTPAEKPQSNTDEKKLYMCPVSSCKKECRGAAEYGAHVSSHYLPNYSTPEPSVQIEQQSSVQNGSHKRSRKSKRPLESQRDLCAKVAAIQKNMHKK